VRPLRVYIIAFIDDALPFMTDWKLLADKKMRWASQALQEAH
jgi:hypothetical protein